jgi:hypothetical protein
MRITHDMGINLCCSFTGIGLHTAKIRFLSFGVVKSTPQINPMYTTLPVTLFNTDVLLYSIRYYCLNRGQDIALICVILQASLAVLCSLEFGVLISAHPETLSS